MMDIKNIPGKLKTTCSFCVWKFEKRNGQKTKMPYNPATGERAKINDLRTFSDFKNTRTTTARKEDSRMADWRTWKKGRKTTWHWNEFDGSGSREGIITEVHEDHAIMEADGMHLWIDDDTAEMFS